MDDCASGIPNLLARRFLSSQGALILHFALLSNRVLAITFTIARDLKDLTTLYKEALTDFAADVPYQLSGTLSDYEHLDCIFVPPTI